MSAPTREIEFKKNSNGWVAQFRAMASPCELLLDSDDESLIQELGNIVAAEAWRIETKFSRYRDDNIVYQINNSQGKAVSVDEETAGLLDFAENAYQLSDGLFDLSSGVLRKLWRFDGSANIPTYEAATALCDNIGWHKVRWQRPLLTLQAGMEIDFGGIGKEYAVDRAATLLKQKTDCAALINFGGDLLATSPPRNAPHWLVGVEQVGGGQSAMIQLKRGGLATSGDANRYLIKDNIRYPHVLNPKTGWPIMNAPRSVTVAAPSCVEAGLIATFAMLAGADADSFLAEQDVLHWIQH
ncbi:FAD:protein FMN transferase [Zhongshania sp. BJYM1]|uniref:FAD:protein FMN transferase n=1 Tax=Zhongshania aquatica TaxID=2965069 RepID=UPI0022B4BDF6|nr:FAD:protein FMN transferase [Marortus sp. BJYM1]